MAILCAEIGQIKKVTQQLLRAEIPHFGLVNKHFGLVNKQNKKAYDPRENRVTVVTIHSSKGLEFPRVILLGVGQLGQKNERLEQDARLVCVGMTRAQECLLLTTSRESVLSKKLLKISEACGQDAVVPLAQIT